MDELELKRWRRDPFRQTIARDLIAMEATYARACTVSREYMIVKVPIGAYNIKEYISVLDTSKCTQEQIRFICNNVTPREYDAANGVTLPEVDRSR